MARAVERLQELKAAGIDTIVDLTVVGLGRDIETVQEVAAQVDLNIVVATGLYTYNEPPALLRLPQRRRSAPAAWTCSTSSSSTTSKTASPEPGCGPGILKCATDKPGLTPGVERILRAVARVHRRTGLPISTHTDTPTRRGLDQQRVFTEEGVDLSRVVIGHSGDSTDLDYLGELLAAGSTLGMDRFGVDAYCTTEQRVETVARLCEGGWTTAMVLSHDAGCHMDWFDDDFLHQAQPNWNFLHISTDVLPALRARGVTEEQIHTMLVDNPRRILDYGPGY